jgi:hypothetical protein
MEDRGMENQYAEILNLCSEAVYKFIEEVWKSLCWVIKEIVIKKINKFLLHWNEIKYYAI